MSVFGRRVIVLDSQIARDYARRARRDARIAALLIRTRDHSLAVFHALAAMEKSIRAATGRVHPRPYRFFATMGRTHDLAICLDDLFALLPRDDAMAHAHRLLSERVLAGLLPAHSRLTRYPAERQGHYSIHYSRADAREILRRYRALRRHLRDLVRYARSGARK